MERFDLKLLTSLAFKNDAGKESTLELMTRNICAGGAYLETNSPLPTGTEVEIDLFLPLKKFKDLDAEKTHIAVSGEVIRVERSGMAICFDHRFQITSIANPI